MSSNVGEEPENLVTTKFSNKLLSQVALLEIGSSFAWFWLFFRFQLKLKWWERMSP